MQPIYIIYPSIALHSSESHALRYITMPLVNGFIQNEAAVKSDIIYSIYIYIFFNVKSKLYSEM